MAMRNLLIALFLTIFAISITFYYCQNSKKCRDILISYLYQKLVYKEAFLNDQLVNINKSFIYILGGSRSSLELKFKEAVRLYNDGFSDQIYILNSKKLTVYDSSLKRNLTNNEWAIRELMSYGMPREHVNFISIDDLKFGTYSEAKTLKKHLNFNDVEHIFLVCSRYHSARVNLTFSSLLSSEATLSIHGADEPVLLRHLLIEFFKFNFYRYILLPFDSFQKNTLFLN